MSNKMKFEELTYEQVKSRIQSVACACKNMTCYIDRNLGGTNFVEWSCDRNEIGLYVEMLDWRDLIEFVQKLGNTFENTNVKVVQLTGRYRPIGRAKKYGIDLKVIPLCGGESWAL
jgi:hypothetical protein